MIEAQALDRVHRIGQLRDVVTIRYIANKSIENVSLSFFSIDLRVVMRLANTDPLVLSMFEMSSSRN